MYHRIGATGQDPWALAVSPEHFSDHLSVLRHHRNVIGLQDLVDRLLRNDVPKDCAVITFDDGYADNLLVAKASLERHGLPATVFVTVAAVDRQAEFWWDELERIVLASDDVPSRLQLDVAGITFSWMQDRPLTSDMAARRPARPWRFEDPPPTQRHALYLDLWRLLQGLPEDERERVLSRLRDWAGVAFAVRADRRTLTQSELLRLAEGGIVDIGAHSISHASLKGRTKVVLESEIKRSKAALEQWLDRPVSTFAYPFGEHDDAAADAARQAGFSCACTTAADAVRKTSDLFRLPRIQVRDWDGTEFDRRLGARFL